MAAAVLSACSSTAVNRAPVEDHGMTVDASRPPTATPAAAVTPAPVEPPGAANAGKPGYYTVRQGDTIRKIAAQVSQPWQEIARWNNLDNPNRIEVGQVLRVAPPVGHGAPPPAAVTPPVAVATQTTPGAAAAPTPAVTPPPVAPTPAADGINFIWPASGEVVAPFDETNNKGLAIAGKAGDPVLAAADGSVVYAGAGLPSYGNLIILQHNNTFITAYAHNQKLLVKEKQTVKQGQKIAERGSVGSDRVQSHFEVRRSGKAVDPARYLPPR
jgi:lipoprotein NlpD